MQDPFETNPYVTGNAPRVLEWDEAAMDTQTELEGFHDSERAAPSLFWLKLSIFVCCLIILVKLFSLQVNQGSVFGALAEGNRIRSQTILAPRGLIFDRNGVPLSQNSASFSLVAIPADLPTEGQDEVIEALAASFNLDKVVVKEQISKRKKTSYEPVILKQDLTNEESILFQTKAQEFPGFAVQSIPIRSYVQAEIFSHLIGYTSVISEDELKQKEEEHYEPNDFIGKYGLELSYEEFLRGVNGRQQVEVDAKGREIRAIGTVDPIPGSTLKLSIDNELQQQIYKSFKKIGNSVKGAAVALNPKTGEVLALLSVPGFDNNLFAHGISSVDYQKLTSDRNLPLFNRAIAGTYPPGSTVKPMVGLAALEYNIVNPSTLINDKGVLVIPNQFDPAISYNFYGWKRDGLGLVNVKSAIAKSSDIYFYTVTGGHPSSSVEGMGPERLADFYRRFNLGKVTGIDLLGEKAGLVADPAWKAEYFKGDKILSKWYLGDTYHIGIGQGDMLTTPLQVSLWTAAIANNGVGYKPYIVKEIIDSKGKSVYSPSLEKIISNIGSEENIRTVQAGMRQTILDGSARQLQSLSISSAGKTGTSQFDGSDPSRTHAWYTSYAPYEDPQIVITILVEAGGEGNAAAVPIAGEALNWWSQHRYNK